MKNLKLFVFSLCLMLVAVLSVNAAQPNGCTLDLEDLAKNTCQAQVTNGKAEDNGLYADKQLAMNNVLKNGGEVTFYADFDLGSNPSNVRTINKNITITMYGDFALSLGHASTASTVIVDDGGSLTVNGKNVTLANFVNVKKGGKFVLNATDVTADKGIALTAGTVEVSANTKATTKVAAVTIYPNASVTLNGKIDSTTLVQAAGNYNKQDEDKDAVVTVNGGTYTTSGDAFVVTNGYVLNIANAKVNAGGRVVNLASGKVSISAGEFTAKGGSGIYVHGTDEETSLTIKGGTLVAKNTSARYALDLGNPNAEYAISGGTFESRYAKGYEAIFLEDSMFDNKTGKLVATGILTGGKYLNNITRTISNKVTAVNYDPNGDLVAEGYEIKEEVVGKDTYKVIVKTGATDVEPEKQPDATKPGSTGSEELPPDTYDAGLTYMGLAVLAVGASVVSVRKLRNN